MSVETRGTWWTLEGGDAVGRGSRQLTRRTRGSETGDVMHKLKVTTDINESNMCKTAHGNLWRVSDEAKHDLPASEKAFY